MKNYRDIVVKESIEKYLNKVQCKTLFIYSPTSANKINLFSKFENKNLMLIGTNELKKDKEILDDFATKNKGNYYHIIGFGGGTAMDISKYLAYMMACDLIIIPSMLSTNAYATNKVSLFENYSKRTFDTKMADEIVLDIELVKNSSKQNLYGFADIFSIHTALADWKIASENNNEIIDNIIYEMSNKLLESAIEFVINNSKSRICNSIEFLYDSIGLAGEITNIYGCGRPESGSEHIFAKTLEEIVNIPHGISVSIGILTMSIIQDNYSERIFKCIKKLGVLEECGKYNITIELIEKTLCLLVPRNDRYTILDLINKGDIDTKKIISIIKKLM